jgi:hypothetical protein
LSPDAFSDELLSRVDQWRPADTPHQDDTTLLVVELVAFGFPWCSRANCSLIVHRNRASPVDRDRRLDSFMP